MNVGRDSNRAGRSKVVGTGVVQKIATAIRHGLPYGFEIPGTRRKMADDATRSALKEPADHLRKRSPVGGDRTHSIVGHYRASSFIEGSPVARDGWRECMSDFARSLEVIRHLRFPSRNDEATCFEPLVSRRFGRRSPMNDRIRIYRDVGRSMNDMMRQTHPVRVVSSSW